MKKLSFFALVTGLILFSCSKDEINQVAENEISYNGIKSVEEFQDLVNEGEHPYNLISDEATEVFAENLIFDEKGLIMSFTYQNIVDELGEEDFNLFMNKTFQLDFLDYSLVSGTKKTDDVYLNSSWNGGGGCNYSTHDMCILSFWKSKGYK